MTSLLLLQDRRFLSFALALAGLYDLTAWAGFALLQPQQTPIPAGQSDLVFTYPNSNYVTEWWQYLFFALYNLAVWTGAYFIASRVVPKFFSKLPLEQG